MTRYLQINAYNNPIFPANKSSKNFRRFCRRWRNRRCRWTRWGDPCLLRLLVQRDEPTPTLKKRKNCHCHCYCNCHCHCELTSSLKTGKNVIVIVTVNQLQFGKQGKRHCRYLGQCHYQCHREPCSSLKTEKNVTVHCFWKEYLTSYHFDQWLTWKTDWLTW